MSNVIAVIDAGGTKTKIAIIDETGKILYEEVGPCGSPAVLKEKALDNIYELLCKVIKEKSNEYNITFVQMGISGLGVINDKTYFEKVWSNELNVEISIENDITMALYNTTKGDKEAVAVISGTGSACGAINNSKIIMNGGWGHMLTEDGSGFASVKMLMIDMIEDYEANNNISSLGADFMAEINIKNINKLRTFVYFNNKYYIAKYSRFVVKKANEGMQKAIEILEQCGNDLAKRVLRLKKQSNISDDAYLGIYGGFINNADITVRALLRELEHNGYKPSLVIMGEDPINGGYYMAKEKGKI